MFNFIAILGEVELAVISPPRVKYSCWNWRLWGLHGAFFGGNGSKKGSDETVFRW